MKHLKTNGNLKKLSEKVTNHQIDQIFSEAYSQGAYGGKILGAGGGGFILFLVPKNKQRRFLKSFSKFLQVPLELTILKSNNLL